MDGLPKIQALVTLSCIAGVLVSLYALRVELKKEEDDDYEALCDISEHVSCTEVLSSRWGRGFGIIGAILGEDSVFNQPNSLAGIVFYALLGIINRFNGPKAANILFKLSCVSNLMSIYLACILYFVLYDFCIVCFTTYAINLALLIFAWRKRVIILMYKKNHQD